MPKLDRERAHKMSLDEAKKTISLIVNDVRDSYPMLVDKIDWNTAGTEAKLKGKMFKGDFTVNDTMVAIHISISMLAKPFMGKVTKRIDSKIEQYFG